MKLPESLRSNIEREFGQRGRDWLKALPGGIELYAERWSLQVGAPYQVLSFGYVAPAERADGTPCVFKLCIPEPRFEFAAGVDCLRLWHGRGCVHLLDADEEGGAVLLERLQPGTMLSELAASDDDEATLALAEAMRTLWRPPPARPHRLIPLRRWFRDLLTHRERTRGPGRFPRSLLDRGVQLAEELLDSTSRAVVLHGDLHHFNVLRAERAPWLAIDPKGLIGDRCFELAAFLRNPTPPPLSVVRRRLDLLTEVLALDRQRARQWCFAEAMLNAAWSHDAPGEEFAERVAWAELMLQI